jgi:putative ABC transport system permease protein
VSTQLPLDCRLLLAAMVRGPGAEHVIGDIHERFADDLESGTDRARALRVARWRARRQAVATIWSWWRPSAVRLRWRGKISPRAATHAAGAGATASFGGGWGFESWISDIRIALRSSRRRLRLSLAVVFTLGLGIGATTTIFSVVNGVLLRPLPFEDPARLVAVGTTFPGREWTDVPGLQHLAGTSMLNYLDFKERARSFEDLAALELTSVLLPDMGDGPQLVQAAMVSEEFFGSLRVSPAMGRFFLPEEYRVGDASVVVITHSAWQQRFGADPAAVGSTIERVGSPVTIVGVLPRGFKPPETIFRTTPDFWLPLQPDHPRYASRGMRSLYLLGRLRPDVSVEQARTEMQVIADQLAIDFPDGNVYPNGTHFGAGVNGLLEETVGSTGRALRLFLGAAGLLLAIAALNAATMLLARGLDRLRELGVRVALGASRVRIFRFLLAESVVLSVFGGLFGLLVAYVGVEVFLRFAPVSIPRTSAVVVDGRVVLVASLVSIGAGLISGLLPAWRHARRSPGDQLRSSGSRGMSGSEGRLRGVLVAAQMALAVVLVAGAALLANSLLRIQSVSPGFDPDGLTSMRVAVKRPGAPEGEATWEAWDLLLREVEAVPGVTAFAGATNPPYQDPFWAPRILLPGEPDETGRSGVAGYAITPGYLETVGTRLVAGRDFTAADGPGDPNVVLVNQAFVREHLGGQNPIGLRLRQVESDYEIQHEIVGVVENVIQTRAEDGMRPAVYFPYTQTDWPLIQVVVRSGLAPEVLIPELRKAAARFSPYVPPADLRTMEARMAATWTTPRFQAILIGSLALTALLLAAAGLYGSLSHSVGRRQRELGIRMALGAKPAGVLAMVVRQGVRLSVTGAIVGIVAALALTRMLEGFLYDVEPTDPATLAAAAVMLALVAVLACVLPARRATRVDPVEVLRAE